LKRHTFTKEEAIARAKAWLDSQSNAPWKWLLNTDDICQYGNGVLNQPRPETIEVAIKQADGGDVGGVVVVVPHGGDDEGAVIAITEYSGNKKAFYWQSTA
jgi:hypothetical protein